MFDLVFPNGNEEKLLEMAKRLGFTEIYLCYDLKDPILKQRRKEVQNASKGIAVGLAVLVKTQQEVQKAKSVTPNVVAVANRWVYEDKRVKFVINMESGRREDFIHHRNSGLTQVSIKNAIRTGKAFLVNIRQLQTGNTATILGRMVQNNRFYRKYDPNVQVISGATQALEMRSPKDLKSFRDL